MSTLSRRHGWTVRQHDSRVCTCAPTNPRHLDGGWQCVTAEQLAAWRAQTPEAINFPERVCRKATWLWLNWSQDPEARRLSGREAPHA